MFTQEEKIEELYHKKLTCIKEELAENIRDNVKKQEPKVALALKYLYGSSPISDIGNYGFDTYLDFALHGVYLMEEGAYSKEMSEELFLPYVLSHRVNEEEIEPCRSLFFGELMEKVKGLSMGEAALEVNYWCASVATYQCSDDRTVSGLTVYKTARGRCGEESTFTVNAMRSVGIPARQVYAPRWSHCDDNHAWVEVWCDGTWYFLGACEPEAVLNRGWFVGASSRAMLEHSRWFDRLREPSGEEVIEEVGMVKLLNQTSRYANTKTLSMEILDTKGDPVKGAKIRANVLNYSELFPVAELISDEMGRADLTLGCGSIVLEASYLGSYSACILDVDKTTECRIILEESTYKSFWGEMEWVEFGFLAPKDAPLHKSQVIREQKEDAKIKSNDMITKRLAKTGTKNEKEIELFLQGVDTEEKGFREKFLKSLNEKDLLDGKACIWQEHFTEAMEFYDTYPEDIFFSYVANPRIYWEVMTPWRTELKHFFSSEEKKKYIECPSSLWTFLQEGVKTIPWEEYENLFTTPLACIKTGVGSKRSKQILMVAVLRSLGIAARLNQQDFMVEYYKEGVFLPLLEKHTKSATLYLVKKTEEVYNYMQNITIGVWNGSNYETMNISSLEFLENKSTISLQPGDYRIITSNRLPNGNIFAASRTCSVAVGESITIPLHQKSARLGDMLEEIALPDFEIKTMKNQRIFASELSNSGSCIYFFLEEAKEPTEHILNELMEHVMEFEECKARLFFIVRSEEALEQVTITKCRKVLPKVEVYLGDFEELIPLLARGMYVDPEKLPLMIVAKRGLKGVYGTCGYNVGTGDMLLKVLDGICAGR